MTDTLKAGDICIVLPDPYPKPLCEFLERYNGEEVELICREMNAGKVMWRVLAKDTLEFRVVPWLLRKKRPPGASWERIEEITGWKPNLVAA